jgi:branched-chain amino acid transport system permease protein
MTETTSAVGRSLGTRAGGLGRVGGLLAALAVLLVLPAFLSSTNTRIATTALIFAIFALSLDLILGYGGMASLGHALFFGAGAYSVGLLGDHYEAPFLVTLPVAIVSAALLAAVVGRIVERTRGAAYMMITLASAQVFWGLAMQWKSLTGGDDGLAGIPRPSIGSLDLGEKVAFYYLVVGFLVVVYLLLRQVVRSPFGYALQGSRESEQRMGVLGVDVNRIRYVALIVSAVIASVAGVLFAYQQRYVSPGVFNVTTSGTVVLMVVLGGAGTLVGAVVGSIVVILVQDLVGSYTERDLLILGVLYVLVALFLPKGLAGLAADISARVRSVLSGRKPSPPPPDPDPSPPDPVGSGTAEQKVVARD